MTKPIVLLLLFIPKPKTKTENIIQEMRDPFFHIVRDKNNLGTKRNLVIVAVRSV